MSRRLMLFLAAVVTHTQGKPSNKEGGRPFFILRRPVTVTKRLRLAMEAV